MAPKVLTEQQAAGMCRRISELERQLRQAQRLESIGALAGGIAHDFNNILFLIVGYTEMCLGRMIHDGHSRKYLEKVLDAAGRAKTLIGQILSFSRDEESEKRPLHFQAVAKETLKLLRSSLPATIAIEARIGKDCPPVLGDPIRLRQILVALAAWTAETIRHGGGELAVVLDEAQSAQVRRRRDSESRRFLRLAVSADACSRTPTNADGSRSPDRSASPGVGGEGLGLSIVRSIVSDHGGFMSVQAGRKTSVEVFLPVFVPEQEAEEPERRQRETLCGTEHVLLVDDDPEVLDMVRTMLEGFGYRVTAAAGSEEALSLFFKDPERFDLVATDLTMPDLVGPQMVEELRKRRPGLPVVLCSGCSRKTAEARCRGAAVEAFVEKPAGAADIAGAIRRALE